MDKTNTIKNNAGDSRVGNSKEPLIHTMVEDIEMLNHDLPKAKTALKNLAPKDLPVKQEASAPPKKPQAASEPPFIPFGNRQKPETAQPKPVEAVRQKTDFVRREDNLPPLVRLIRQGAPKSANLMPKSEKLQGAAPMFIRKSPAEIPKGGRRDVWKNIFIIIFSVALIFSAYYFLKPIFNKPATVILPPAEIPASLVADVKDVSISADFSPELTLIIRKYMESNKNRADIYGASRLIIKNARETEILKIENLKNFLGINLPPEFLQAVDKNYTLLSFNYPENNYLRFGLVFKIIKPETIERAVLNWEPAMVGDVSPLFLGAPAFYVPDKNFASNAYLGASIRYLPLGEAHTALNYAIGKNKTFFMITTSKEDIYYLIEKTTKNQ